MLRHELVGDVHVHAADGAKGSREHDEQVQAARDLPPPEIARRRRAPVVRRETRARTADRTRRFDDAFASARRFPPPRTPG